MWGEQQRVQSRCASRHRCVCSSVTERARPLLDLMRAHYICDESLLSLYSPTVTEMQFASVEYRLLPFFYVSGFSKNTLRYFWLRLLCKYHLYNKRTWMLLSPLFFISPYRFRLLQHQNLLHVNSQKMHSGYVGRTVLLTLKMTWNVYL